MKKILIATTNKDKYKIVKALLKMSGLDDENYEIMSLRDIKYDGPDNKEVGNIEERAIAKAKSVHDYLKDSNYDCIIGIDDGIRLKGMVIENIKEYLTKILYENYLLEKEEFSFPRAYCFLEANGKMHTTIIEIPYEYKYRDGAVLKEYSYPLSQIAVPIGYEKTIADLTEKESLDYYWKYSKEKLCKIIEEIK